MTTVGGYLTKEGTVYAGAWELRVRLVPTSNVELPRSMQYVEGYYTDEHCDETMRPCVALLPHGRFLAGWNRWERVCRRVSSCRLRLTSVTHGSRRTISQERDAEQEREVPGDTLAGNAWTRNVLAMSHIPIIAMPATSRLTNTRSRGTPPHEPPRIHVWRHTRLTLDTSPRCSYNRPTLDTRKRQCDSH